MECTFCFIQKFPCEFCDFSRVCSPAVSETSKRREFYHSVARAEAWEKSARGISQLGSNSRYKTYVFPLSANCFDRYINEVICPRLVGGSNLADVGLVGPAAAARLRLINLIAAMAPRWTKTNNSAASADRLAVFDIPRYGTFASFAIPFASSSWSSLWLIRSTC